MRRLRQILAGPHFMRRATRWGIWASLVLWAMAIATGLIYSVAWVSHLSQLALVLTMLSWWQSARVEAAAVDQMEEMIRRVVDEILTRTTVEPAGPPEAR